MGDLKRGVKRGWNSLKKTWDDVMEGSQQMGESIGLGSVTGESDKTKRRQARAAAALDAANQPIPMADEEEIKRNKRRANASRGGGRASTILTDGDRLGP